VPFCNRAKTAYVLHSVTLRAGVINNVDANASPLNPETNLAEIYSTTMTRMCIPGWRLS